MKSAWQRYYEDLALAAWVAGLSVVGLQTAIALHSVGLDTAPDTYPKQQHHPRLIRWNGHFIERDDCQEERQL